MLLYLKILHSADSRIRKETIVAEDVLQDMGVFSMISSDSQAMGRVGGYPSYWQVAHRMKAQRGFLEGDSEYNDNNRINVILRNILSTQRLLMVFLNT